MALRYNDIWNGVAAMNHILSLQVKGKEAMRLNISIRHLIREVSPVVDDIREMIKTIIDEHAVRDEAGAVVQDKDGSIRIKEDEIDEFNSEYNALMMTEINVERLIPMDVFLDASDWIGEVSQEFVGHMFPLCKE